MSVGSGCGTLTRAFLLLYVLPLFAVGFYRIIKARGA